VNIKLPLKNPVSQGDLISDHTDKYSSISETS